MIGIVAGWLASDSFSGSLAGVLAGVVLVLAAALYATRDR